MRSILAVLALSLTPLLAAAHGPSPQKIVKETVIRAEPEKVWAVLTDFGAIDQWHGDVAEVTLEARKDSESEAVLKHRMVKFKDGLYIVEKLREATVEEFKLDYKMVEGTVPVSNYRAVMQVKPGPGTGESTLVWTGRFYNMANSLEAPPGQDNPAAVAAINRIYDVGLEGIKRYLEKE
jgi:mxaD protein